jgi:hypothetical protein
MRTGVRQNGRLGKMNPINKETNNTAGVDERIDE